MNCRQSSKNYLLKPVNPNFTQFKKIFLTKNSLKVFVEIIKNFQEIQPNIRMHKF